MVVASTYAGHTLVCGMGQFGATVCGGLLARGRRVVGVDLNEHLATVVTARRAESACHHRRHDQCRNADGGQHQARLLRHHLLGNDLSNIEAAIRVHDLNPSARLFVRLYRPPWQT